MSQRDFTVCVLLYGDFPELAERCLGSIVQQCPRERIDLRIGLNEVSIRTQAVVNNLVISQGWLNGEQDLYVATTNACKYPLMRRMFHDPDNPVTSPYIVWFDDDSYLVEGASKQSLWLDRLAIEMQTTNMAGAVYNQHFGGNQHLWVRDQPWYTGKTVAKGQKAVFATGGWWCIESAIIRKYDWPIPALRHRGGDVMLGELLRQQGIKLNNFRDGVAINADEEGRESKAPRRGFDEKAIGVVYEPGAIQTVAMLEPTPSMQQPPMPPPTTYFNPGL